MSEFKVIEVIDGDTIKLSPGWVWKINDQKNLAGETIKILGYELPAKGTFGFNFATEKLKKLLLHKSVTLKNAIVLEISPKNDVKIACRVSLNDVDVANYFPEYKA